jgi:sigma-B regulation protein RsbU (phosphoserine phosphatase)
VRAAGGIEELEVPGFVLGRMRAARFPGVTLSLGAGDALVFYTDGVTEARRQGEDFGVERLRAAIGGSSAKEVAEAITREVRAWGGAELEDDVTLVVVKRA